MAAYTIGPQLFSALGAATSDIFAGLGAETINGAGAVVVDGPKPVK
jgi:hypothetical protein